MSGGGLLNPTLATDLEGLLLSCQDQPGVLLEGLLFEYELPLRRLAWVILENETAVRRAVCQAMARAVVERHDFREGMAAKAWFFKKAVWALRQGTFQQKRNAEAAPPVRTEAWRELQASAWYIRVGGLLLGVLGWSVAETCAVVGVPAVEAARQVEEADHERSWETRREYRPVWQNAVVKAYPQAKTPLTEGERSALQATITGEEARQGRRRWLQASLLELAWMAPLVAAAILAILATLP